MTPRPMTIRERVLHAVTWLIVFASGIVIGALVLYVVGAW